MGVSVVEASEAARSAVGAGILSNGRICPNFLRIFTPLWLCPPNSRDSKDFSDAEKDMGSGAGGFKFLLQTGQTLLDNSSGMISSKFAARTPVQLKLR